MLVRKLFFTVFFLLSAAALAITAMTTVDTGQDNMEIRPVEQDYQTVMFLLKGNPQNELAVWVGPEVIAAYLQNGESVSLDFTWKQLEQVSLRQRMGDDWKTVKTFHALKWGTVIRIEIENDGAVKASFSSQF